MQTKPTTSLRRLASPGTAVAALLFACALGTTTAHATTYSGNGGTGFGGGVGNSTLTITSTATAINFSLATTGFNGNALAIYLDTKAGGVNNTSTFTDAQDGNRVPLSGLSSNGRTLLSFVAGVGADYAISVTPGSFGGVFNLSTPANFGFIGGVGLDTTATTTLNFSVNRADIGLSATAGFTFEASLISSSGYRSNETIGTSVTTVNPASPGDAPNAGFTGSQTFSTLNTFGTPVPEPSTWAAMLLGGLGVLGVVKRARRTRQA